MTVKTAKKPKNFKQTKPANVKDSSTVKLRTLQKRKRNILCELEKYPHTKPVQFLTDQEELFCREYIRSHNRTKAIDAAGFELKDSYNNKAAYFDFLLKKPHIINRLAQLWEEKKERLGLDAPGVLEELARIATMDINDFYTVDEKGKIKLKPKFDGRMVKGMRSVVDSNGVRSVVVDFWDKNKALENMGKHFKLFTDIIEQTNRVQMFQIGEQTIEF